MPPGCLWFCRVQGVCAQGIPWDPTYHAWAKGASPGHKLLQSTAASGPGPAPSGEVASGKLRVAPVASHPCCPASGVGLLKLEEAAGSHQPPRVGVGLWPLTNLESETAKNDAGTVGPATPP